MEQNNEIQVKFSPDLYFRRSISPHPVNSEFMLHNHRDMIEILIFIRGDAEFRVEGSTYKLKPFDTVIASNFEMHKIVHLSDTEYERIVITIPADFFEKNNCVEYADLIYSRPLGVNNLIPYDITKNTYFLSTVNRLELYISDEGCNSIIAVSAMIELLYILNKCSKKTILNENNNKFIKNIILYINDNLTSNLSLEKIADQFYINKSYLCRMFKKNTGYTINKYITHKRLMLVRELCSTDMSLTEACIEAGFGNYSNFYKMYVKETGTSPRKELKKSTDDCKPFL